MLRYEYTVRTLRSCATILVLVVAATATSTSWRFFHTQASIRVSTPSSRRQHPVEQLEQLEPNIPVL
eukprot:scaffold366014_cov37-Prasinocladus_malaysianus.AAC.1